MSYSNYHTHTKLCDGTDSPEELVLEAIRLGCPELGFSGHSYAIFDLDCCMSKQGTLEYIETISALKVKYADRIKILLGIEQDYYSDMPTDGYDYVIGAVHCLLKDGEYLCVDASRERQIKIVEQRYKGDFYAFAEHYYETLSGVYDKTHCDIIAHFDLVTKFNEGNSLFDTSHPRYRAAAMTALTRLLKSGARFELNTGAISRGYRTQPYPEPFLLEAIKAGGGEIILSSDCHAKANLLFGFDKFVTTIA